MAGRQPGRGPAHARAQVGGRAGAPCCRKLSLAWHMRLPNNGLLQQGLFGTCARLAPALHIIPWQTRSVGRFQPAPCLARSHHHQHPRIHPLPTHLPISPHLTPCSEMFSANYLIVSQTNPRVVPLLNARRALGTAGTLAEAELKHRWAGLASCCCAGVGVVPAAFGCLARAGGITPWAQAAFLAAPWAAAPRPAQLRCSRTRLARRPRCRCRQLAEVLPAWLPTRTLHALSQPWEGDVTMVRAGAPRLSACVLWAPVCTLPSPCIPGSSSTGRRPAPPYLRPGPHRVKHFRLPLPLAGPP